MSEANTNMENSYLDNLEEIGLYGKHIANIQKGGGQLGVGYKPTKLDAATPLVFTPTVVVVLQTPTMWDSVQAKSETLKSIIETHPKAISGLDFNYTMDVGDTPAGHDSQLQEVPLKCKRSATAPSFTFTEVNGNLIWEFFKNWMFDINNPDTNTALGFVDNENAHFTMSAYSMTMLGIQFDPTGDPKNIIGGAVYTNMFPKGTGDFGFERTIGTSKVMERTIEFSSIVHHNDYTRDLAIQVAETLKLATANYNKLKTGLTGVNSAISEVGLAQAVTQINERQG